MAHLTKPLWVHRSRHTGLQAFINGERETPTWIVEVLAPGLDYFVLAGFPTWREAMDYANANKF